MTTRMPKLIAFDLDFTLWDFWIDSHITPPLKRDGTTGIVTDGYLSEVAFYVDVPSILHRVRTAGVRIAACSRTSAPKLAREALSLITVHPRHSQPMRAVEYFDELEIYPGSKLTHFKRLHERTGIPYSEMLFFDDEPRNREVECLGVTFQLVEEGGLDDRTFERGLSDWRRLHPADVVEDAGQ